MRAYKFHPTLEPGGHDVWSACKEGAPSRWGVRQTPGAKARVRRALKRSNNRLAAKYEAISEGGKVFVSVYGATGAHR